MRLQRNKKGGDSFLYQFYIVIYITTFQRIFLITELEKVDKCGLIYHYSPSYNLKWVHSTFSEKTKIFTSSYWLMKTLLLCNDLFTGPSYTTCCRKALPCSPCSLLPCFQCSNNRRAGHRWALCRRSLTLGHASAFWVQSYSGLPVLSHLHVLLSVLFQGYVNYNTTHSVSFPPYPWHALCFVMWWTWM